MKYLINLFSIKTPSNIYLWWNFGSMISIYLIFQLLTGMILSMNYFIKFNPFISSFHIYYNMNYGWMIRIIHSNLTSMLFILMIIHINRNMIFSSFYNQWTWISGTFMFLFMMIEAFIGYSLIWNQMSYWAMMVITNFIASIPYIGLIILSWLWGNFNINNILINRFFSIHFFLPFFMLLMIFIHLMFLHKFKSNNPLGINNKIDLMNLNPIQLSKDLNLFISLSMFFMNMILINPFYFNNYDNFIMMNYFQTPSHIQPEWYFLLFYSILRSINNKFNGLMMLLLFLILIFLFPMLNNNKFQTFNINNFWMLINMIIIINLSFLGTMNIEYPYNLITPILIYSLFFNYFISYFINKVSNKMF